jgi:hypothetical protein
MSHSILGVFNLSITFPWYSSYREPPVYLSEPSPTLLLHIILKHRSSSSLTITGSVYTIRTNCRS